MTSKDGSCCDWGDVKIVQAGRKDIEYVYRHISHSDINELKGLLGVGDYLDMVEASKTDNISLCAIKNGTPVAYIGVRNDDMLGMSGKIYIILTEAIRAHPITIGVVSKRVIMLIKQFYNRLHNIKPSNKLVDIKWLKSLGFRFYDTDYTDKEGNKLLYFELTDYTV